MLRRSTKAASPGLPDISMVAGVIRHHDVLLGFANGFGNDFGQSGEKCFAFVVRQRNGGFEFEQRHTFMRFTLPVQIGIASALPLPHPTVNNSGLTPAWQWLKFLIMKRDGNRIAAEAFETPLRTPTDLSPKATQDISGAMNAIQADVFALYVKTKNFHWHMSGPHFRDYHLLLDEHADQIFAMTDDVAERVRKIGGMTLRSIGQISKMQRILDNDAPYVEPLDMIAELAEDNKTLAARLREAHELCDEYHDVGTASMIEVWIDQTERRTWFLFETSRAGTPRH